VGDQAVGGQDAGLPGLDAVEDDLAPALGHLLDPHATLQQ